MSSYKNLATAFKNGQTYRYDPTLSCNGTKIICTRGDWIQDPNTFRWTRTSDTPVILAEWVEHEGESYAVVYNRGNKCFASQVLGYFSATQVWLTTTPVRLKYGEIGKPVKEQQINYRCQLIDALIYNGAVTHLLIPTSHKGDSEFFKKI
jgi:hypothetical protein|tara:strand:- start:143 stop:592 length:450 start_codon:yes stop_codon:yes gene_type:complete